MTRSWGWNAGAEEEQLNFQAKGAWEAGDWNPRFVQGTANILREDAGVRGEA